MFLVPCLSQLCIFSVVNGPERGAECRPCPCERGGCGRPPGDGCQEQTSPRPDPQPWGPWVPRQSINEASLKRNAQGRARADQPEKAWCPEARGRPAVESAGGWVRTCSFRVLVTLWNMRTRSGGKSLDSRRRAGLAAPRTPSAGATSPSRPGRAGGLSNKHLFIADRVSATMAFVCGGIMGLCWARRCRPRGMLTDASDAVTLRGLTSCCLGSLKWQRVTFPAGQQSDFHFPGPRSAQACPGLVTLLGDLQAGTC